MFSHFSFRQAPFFVLDEVDAALDNVNVKKVGSRVTKPHFCLGTRLSSLDIDASFLVLSVFKDLQLHQAAVSRLPMRGDFVEGDVL